jgi:Fe-S-cluster-containing dehydrogenase component
VATQQKRYGLAIDSKKCIDCKACLIACRAEHSVPLEYSRNWIGEELRGSWPHLSAAFEPGQCQQCEDPACVRVCPTGASRKRSDGVVVVDDSECVGCRYCIISCPYGARFFREDRGVVEKCDFCIRRVEAGRWPACVETCPTKVRIFGDLNDPNSRLSKLLATRRYEVKKPEAGTGPNIYYLL